MSTAASKVFAIAELREMCLLKLPHHDLLLLILRFSGIEVAGMIIGATNERRLAF